MLALSLCSFFVLFLLDKSATFLLLNISLYCFSFKKKFLRYLFGSYPRIKIIILALYPS